MRRKQRGDTTKTEENEGVMKMEKEGIVTIVKRLSIVTAKMNVSGGDILTTMARVIIGLTVPGVNIEIRNTEMTQVTAEIVSDDIAVR